MTDRIYYGSLEEEEKARLIEEKSVVASATASGIQESSTPTVTSASTFSGPKILG